MVHSNNFVLHLSKAIDDTLVLTESPCEEATSISKLIHTCKDIFFCTTVNEKTGTVTQIRKEDLMGASNVREFFRLWKTVKNFPNVFNIYLVIDNNLGYMETIPKKRKPSTIQKGKPLVPSSSQSSQSAQETDNEKNSGSDSGSDGSDSDDPPIESEDSEPVPFKETSRPMVQSNKRRRARTNSNLSIAFLTESIIIEDDNDGNGDDDDDEGEAPPQYTATADPASIKHAIAGEEEEVRPPVKRPKLVQFQETTSTSDEELSLHESDSDLPTPEDLSAADKNTTGIDGAAEAGAESDKKTLFISQDNNTKEADESSSDELTAPPSSPPKPKAKTKPAPTQRPATQKTPSFTPINTPK